MNRMKSPARDVTNLAFCQVFGEKIVAEIHPGAHHGIGAQILHVLKNLDALHDPDAASPVADRLIDALNALRESAER